MVMQKALVVSLFLALACQGSGFRLEQEDAMLNTKARPVTKVMNLLKDMSKQLEKEGEEDAEVYDKMVCWCETNDKEKTKAISDAEHKIEALGNSIEDLTANSAKLTQEISTLETEVAKSNEALSKATAMRSKELDDFNSEDKEALQSIGSLKSAVTVLGKHNSFLQTGSGVGVSMRGELRKVARILRSLPVQDLAEKVALVPKQKRELLALLQTPEDEILSALQQPASAGSYAPAGGQIFGILKNMKESFEANAASAQKDEADAVATYQEMKAAKEDEIAAGVAQIQAKTQELASSDENCANDKQSKKDTETTLEADQKFLANLKDTCANLDAENDERQKARTLEIEACGKALAVLSSDDAHDLMSSTFNSAAFLQKRSKFEGQRRAAASRVLASAAKRHRSPKLGMLATAVRLDAFKKVKESIENMVNALVKEKTDEIEFKDYCIESFNTNAAQTAMKDKDKNDLTAKIDDLTNTVGNLKSELDGLHASAAEMRKQLKRGGEDRELENQAFQGTVADQRATQKLLKSALNILAEVYGAAFVQQKGKQHQVQAPPAKFKKYEKNENSGGVMGMLNTIIADAARAEADAVRAESDAQKAYENFVKDTNDALDATQVEITNTGEAKAKNEGELTEAKADFDAVMANLEALSKANAGLHGECDFVLKNFDTRQANRDDEIEALKDSISILSGAR